MNLASLLANHAAYQPQRMAVEAGGEPLTYAAFDQASRRLAGRLRAAGVGVGDLVGVNLRDTAVHVAAFFAVNRLGAVILPLDWRAQPAEVSRVVERFRPKLVLIDRAVAEAANTLSVERPQESEPDGEPPVILHNAPQVFALTSGTTGAPKALVVTHEQVYARFVARAFEGMIARDDRYLVPLPLAFSAGREHSCAPIYVGATLVMFPTLFEPAELVKAVNERGITATVTSPNVTRALLGLKGGPGRLLMPNLRAYVSTTGKLDPADRAAIRARLAPHLIDYYGASGAGPVAVVTNDADGREPTAAGRVMPGVDVEIVDEEHRRVPTGEVGTVRLQGPGLTTAFAGGTTAGDEGIRDGWYYPGDLGRFDNRGLLHLHGRSSELIKRGGLMVHAQEVEQVLKQHADIAEVAVVGVPAPDLGEKVVAFVVTRAPIDEAELARFCRAALAPFKVPAEFQAIDALPRNASGKVLKEELKRSLAPTV